jgi:hypothetical protein
MLGGRVQGVRRDGCSWRPARKWSRERRSPRLSRAIIPTTTNAVLSEAHQTWNRPEAAEIAELYALVSPNYAAVVESYKAQEVAKQSGQWAAKHALKDLAALGDDDTS